jgi:hypothetical protein
MHPQAHRLVLVFSAQMFYTCRHDAPNDQLAGTPARFQHEYDTSKGRSQLRSQTDEGSEGESAQQEA